MAERSEIHTMSTSDFESRARSILEELSRVVVGKVAYLEKLLCVILAGDHVLIEDLPGLAKTLTARGLRCGGLDV